MAKLTDKLKSLWPIGNTPAGNVLQGNTISNGNVQVVNQQTVKLTEPYGTKIPKRILDRATGWSQISNLSHNFTTEKIQSAFRAAERGDMTQLFGYYRDFFTGNGMVVSELGKRKLSTIAEPFNIIPRDKTNKEDENAANVITEALDKCPEFRQSLSYLMNAVVFPVSVLEKIFEPIDEDYGTNKYNLRYKIKKLYAVDYQLITYRLPYIPQGPINIGNQPVIPSPPLEQNLTGRPEDTIYDPDSWEPDLRFWSVFENGLINYSYAYMMAPDPDRHIVYRCNLLNGIARENFGGLGKSLLWWTIMSQLGADVFLRCLQKFGLPFIVAHVDTTQVDTVNAIMESFGNLNIVSAMAVNKDAIIEIQEMNYSGAADAHTKFLELCKDQISLIINGQTLSSNAKSTGLGSGVANLQGQVREDIIKYDRLCLAEVLETQLFKQYLNINGVKGSVPKIVFGGDTPENMTDLSNTLNNLKLAGLEPTNDSIQDLSETLGFTIQRVESNDSSESDSNTDSVIDKSDTL